MCELWCSDGDVGAFKMGTGVDSSVGSMCC